MSDNIQPKADPRTTTSPDVPSSTDPQDINNGLSQSPELSRIEILQNKTLALSEVIKKHDAEGLKLSPDMVDELKQHAKIRDGLQGQMVDLCKEITDLNNGAGRGGPAPGGRQGSGGNTLHFPVLDKALDLLIAALKALIELFAKGARLLRNMLPNAPAPTPAATGSPAPAKRDKTVLGMNLPGGPVSVTPPEVKAVKPATPEEVQDAGEKALDHAANRQKDIKNTLEAEAEKTNDSDGPAPGTASRKPK